MGCVSSDLSNFYFLWFLHTRCASSVVCEAPLCYNLDRVAHDRKLPLEDQSFTIHSSGTLVLTSSTKTRTAFSLLLRNSWDRDHKSLACKWKLLVEALSLGQRQAPSSYLKSDMQNEFLRLCEFHKGHRSRAHLLTRSTRKACWMPTTIFTQLWRNHGHFVFLQYPTAFPTFLQIKVLKQLKKC